DAFARPRGVDAADERHRGENQERERADAEFEQAVDSQRMLARRHDPRQQQAAETHAAHERAEQNPERDGRRSNHELQQLEPDDLVDQRRATAADEQQKERGKIAAWLHGVETRVYTERAGGKGRGASWLMAATHLPSAISRAEALATSRACLPAWSSR